MSARKRTRTQRCGKEDARTRWGRARAFLDAAELMGAEENQLATPSVAAALAVLAGIAASDAACCAALGQRSRGDDHRQALALLGQVTPQGAAMRRDLGRLLTIKDDAHYGTLDVSRARAAAAVRQARRLVEAAERLVR